MTLAAHQFSITDENGNVIPGAHVEVRAEIPGQPLVPLYSDRAGSTPLGNPFDAGSDGFVRFFVTGGAYQIRVYTGASGAPTFEAPLQRYVGIGLLTETDTVPLTSLAGQPAYTFLANNTGSPAPPTAIDIPSLTAKSSPEPGDYLMISDQSAGGALKKSTLAEILSGGVDILYASSYGVVCDYATVTGNTSISSGTPNLTVVGASFVADDIGKIIQVPGAGAAAATLSTTIIARVSPTQVTLGANASTTLSAVSKTISYATNNAANFQAFLEILERAVGLA